MESGDYDKRAIGRRIAAARREAGYTQAELADLVGVKQRAVQAWEYGRTNPYRRLRELERALGRPRAWILRGEAAAPPASLHALEEVAAGSVDSAGGPPPPPRTFESRLSDLERQWLFLDRAVALVQQAVQGLQDEVSQLRASVAELDKR